MSGGPLPWSLPQVLPGTDVPATVSAGDLCAESLALLIRQYQDSPRLRALVCLYVDRLQEIDDAALAILTRVLDVSAAEGANLDVLGRIVREPRNGRADYRYRQAIRARVAANRSQGRREDLILVASLFDDLVSEVGAVVRVQGVQPARVEVRIERTKINPPQDVDAFQRRSKAAGVALTTIVVPYPYERTRLFRLSRAADYPPKNTTTGLSRVAHRTTGGALAFALS